MKLALTTLLFSTALALAGDPFSFQQLRPGDSIHVTFSSIGCFHSDTFEFDFQQAASATARVTQVSSRWNEATNRREETKRALLGTVPLSKAELAGLDRLFTFYRARKPGACTTADKITATYQRGDTVQATESFTDETCATYQMKNLTLLSSIAGKLTSKQK